MRKMLLTTVLAGLALGVPALAQAQVPVVQDTVNGSQRGYNQGNDAAGPIGGIVGGAVGAGVGAATGAVNAATGIVGGIFGTPDDRPRFHDYAVQQHRPSVAYPGNLAVGSVLPRRVALFPVPREYHVSPRYRYAMVNDQTVIVDPRTRRVVDIID